MVQTISILVKTIDKATGDLKRIKTQFDEFGRVAKTTTTTVDKLGNSTTKVATAAKYSTQQIRMFDTWSQRTGKSAVDLERGLKMQGITMKRNGQLYDMFGRRVENVGKAFKDAGVMTNRFQMHLLSVMFFGMLLQRVFMGLARTGVDTMMKITEGQSEAGMAITTLSASFQYLKFIIGDAIGTALLPWLDTITGIVETVGDWINQYPELTAGIIIAGAAIGSFLFLVGTLGLGLQGVSILIGGAGSGLIGKISGAGAGSLVGALAALSAALVIAAAGWEANWAKVRETTTIQGNIIMDTIGEIWGVLVNTFSFDWEKVMNSFKRIGVNAFFYIASQFVSFANKMIDTINVFWTLIGNKRIPTIDPTFLDRMRENALRNFTTNIPVAPTTTPTTTTTNSGNFTVTEMNINVSSISEGAREAGIEAGRAVLEAAAHYGYTPQGGI